MGQLAEQISTCLLFEKKELMIRLLYSFSPPTPSARHQMISAFKEAVKDGHIFMQSLVVLIQFEEYYGDANAALFEDFMHYAILNIFSASTDLRTMSLALLCHIADLVYIYKYLEYLNKYEKPVSFTF
jgi:hypothetical protein